MDFEQAYERYRNGTASEEEKAFIESEIKKARALNDIIDAAEKKDVIGKADEKDVREARKKYGLRTAIRTGIIALAVLIVLAIASLSAVFGIGIYSANKNMNVSEEQARTIAIEFVTDNFAFANGSATVLKVKKDLDLRAHLGDSVYYYEIDLMSGIYQIELEINSRTGLVEDYDIDD